MAKGDIRLGTSGSEVLISAIGRTLNVKPIETSRERRTIDGTLWKDRIYLKYQFTLNYESIFGDDLAVLENIYNTVAQPMSLILDLDGITPKSYVVYMKPLEKERFRLQGDGIWNGVTVVLDEK